MERLHAGVWVWNNVPEEVPVSKHVFIAIQFTDLSLCIAVRAIVKIFLRCGIGRVMCR